MAADSALLASWFARAGDPRTAFEDPTGTTAWSDAVETSERVASALLAGRRSLEGERVALLVSPGARFVTAFFGVLRAGGAAVVLSPLHPPPETRYFCDDAGVRTIVTSPDLAERVAFLAPDRRVALVDHLAASPPGPPSPLASSDDPALQLYTSGTTGKPKGAVITHGNLATQQELLRSAWGWRAEDVLLHVLPLHHMHGLAIALLSAIGAGAATTFLPGFDARATWAAMERATVFMAVPTIHAKLFGALDAATAAERDAWTAHARALRLVTSGSAALPVRVGDRWRTLTGAYPLERFGMTEIGVGTTNPFAPSGRRPGTVGLPLPTVDTRIVDDELWIAGPSVFAGYHAKPEATETSFVVERGTRWFKTGDTVARDEDGYVRILGRTSVDILKSGGYKLSALEIEEALREHAAVAEVAVVGIPDDTWGERVVACVVPRAGRDAECAEDLLRGFAKERLAPYKVPRQVLLLKELPRNAIGKVVKPVLRDQVTTLTSP
ncbi:MAG TPA: AMP-binding protein [Polyangiaceae bacterium]|jgi:malonyl-CoA/methylmalonyl-CoA synthetase